MKAADMFEDRDGAANGVLRVGPRHTRPVTDDLVLSVRHRTTGDGRSFLLDKDKAVQLRDWLSRWLDEGWDGVRR